MQDTDPQQHDSRPRARNERWTRAEITNDAAWSPEETLVEAGVLVLGLWEPEAACIWLLSANSKLAGARPIDVLALRGPREILDAIELAHAGAYS